jgi:5-methylcytosine-specific restriction endonuclease McrA
MPLHNCTQPGCGVTLTKPGRCPEHRRATERGIVRGRRTEAWRKGKKWQLTSRRVCREEPICPGYPAGFECGRLTEVCDHILSTTDGGAPFERSNLQALCRSCASRKTADEVRGRTFK